MSINTNTLEILRESMLRKYVQSGLVLDIKPIKHKESGKTEEVVQLDFMGTQVYCEKSQFSTRKVASFKGFMGTTVPFIVKDIQMDTGIVVVSRVEALPIVQRRFLKNVKEGDTVRGTVTGVIADKNIVFVECEGFSCMIPPGEYDLNMVTDIDEVVGIGQEVQCKVLKIEKASDDKNWEFDYKIRLSRRAILKQERDLKWDEIEKIHSVGDSVFCKVVYRLPGSNSYLIEILSSGVVVMGNLQSPFNVQFKYGLPLGLKVKAEIIYINKHKQEGKARIFQVDPTLTSSMNRNG